MERSNPPQRSGGSCQVAPNCEHLALEGAQFLVASHEILRVRAREQVGVEVRRRLIVPAVGDLDYPAVADRVVVADADGTGVHSPAVGVVAVHAVDRRAVPDEVLCVDRRRSAGSRVRIDLRFPGEARGDVRVEIAGGAIRVVQVALVGDGLHREARREPRRDDLVHAQAVGPAVHGLVELRIAPLGNVVPGAAEAERNGGQVAEQRLAHVQARGVGGVVVLVAVGVGHAVLRPAVQHVESEAGLSPLFLVGTRLRQHVDRSARDEVHVVVRRDRVVLADLLAYQQRRAVDRYAATVVTMVEGVRPVFRQHGRAGRRGERDGDGGEQETGTGTRLHGEDLSCSRSRRRGRRAHRARLRVPRIRGRYTPSTPGRGWLP